jgi:hypothetical protein
VPCWSPCSPPNVYKALTDSTIGVDDQLGPRTVLQVVFLAATLAVVSHHVRRSPAQ